MTTPGNGQPATPYKSLSWALTTDQNLAPGWTVMVAGNGPSSPYKNTSGANPDETETFPIQVPAGVRLLYWDSNGLLPHARPPNALFRPGSATGLTCFKFSGGATTQPQGISAYLQTTVTPIPDLNQGFEIREFEKAFEIDDLPSISTLYVFLDGVAAYDCQIPLTVIKNGTGTFDVLVKRSVFRGPTGAVFQPTTQVVRIEFDGTQVQGSFSPNVELRNCDMRPQTLDLQSSMVTILNNGTSNDYLTVQFKNCHISGQPLVPPVQPNPINKILGAGVEAVWTGSARGRVSIQDSQLWDAEGDGVLGSVQGGQDAQGEIQILGSDVAYHGVSNITMSPLLAAATFSGSGIHLAAVEEGDWLNVDFNTTAARDNFRHGAFLEIGSFQDEIDGFHNVDVDFCNFSRNGLGLDTSVEGHGFYVNLKEATINLEMHRSLLARNHTTGLKTYLRSGDTSRHQVLEITNTVMSANEGKSGSDPGNHPWYLPRHISPFTVMSEEGDHTSTINLSHVTFTDCAAPYAVSIFEMDDSSYGFNYQQLWSSASTVDNSVLNKNHFTHAGGFADQAYYPEPPDPNNPPPGGHLWLRMFDSTSESNLGILQPVYAIAYTTARGNFYANPMLESLTFLGTSLGLVFPGTSGGNLSPLVDNGGSPVFASESTDVRGGVNHPRVVDYGNNGSPVRDVGAFELQN